MTLALSEITQCIFEQDAKPLPKHKGPPLDDVPDDATENRTPTAAELRLMESVPLRRPWSTEQIARVAGLDERLTGQLLHALWRLQLVEQHAGGNEKRPVTWTKVRGNVAGLNARGVSRVRAKGRVGR